MTTAASPITLLLIVARRTEGRRALSTALSRRTTAAFHPSRITLPDTTSNEILRRSRWRQVPFATANHICLGSVFAWSIFNQPLMRLHGVVAAAPNDWTLSQVTLTFSLVMGGFAWGAVLSKYLDPLGPRTCGLLGAASLGTGFALASVAAEQHSLPLLYAGGLVWGVSNGVAYVPPVSNLMKWFPDRKGFASGVVVVGYGGGALIAAPVFEYLLRRFQRAPSRFEVPDSSTHADVLINAHGKTFVETAPDVMTEVVVATAKDVTKMFPDEFTEGGIFLLNSGGDTGVAKTFLVLGAVYGSIMTLSAFAYRVPPPSWYQTSSSSSSPSSTTTPSVAPKQQSEEEIRAATYGAPFLLLYLGFTFASTGAYALISSSKLIASSFPAFPPEHLTAFVQATSVSNLTGRLIYSNLSDALAGRLGNFPGRRATYSWMWGVGPLGHCGIVWSLHNDSLPVFLGSTFVVLSSFGGSAAIRPAIVSDMYGAHNVAALSARQLSAVLPAAMLGPQLVSYFSERATAKACEELSTHLTEAEFHHAFGADKTALPELVASKACTIDRLMEVIGHREGLVDPSPFVYDNALLTAAGLTTLALICNGLTKNPTAAVVLATKENENVVSGARKV